MPGRVHRAPGPGLRSGRRTRTVHQVFLDFGGTLTVPLVDTRPIFQRVARRLGARLSWDVFDREYDRAWQELGPSSIDLVGRRPCLADRVHETALRRSGVRGPVAGLVAGVRKEMLAPRWHAPYPETETVLRTLRARGYALHVVSNHTDYLPRILENLGWLRLFSTVSFSQEVGANKPDPRLFQLALSRAGCPPAEVLHVGDQWDADYQGARSVGIRAVWLNRGGATRPGPGWEVHDLRELLAWLPGVPGRMAREPTATSGRQPIIDPREVGRPRRTAPPRA